MEITIVIGERILQARTIQCRFDNLTPQLLLRAQRHVLQRHLAQSAEITLEIPNRLTQLQRKQSTQTRPMNPRGFFRRIERFDVAMRDPINERRIAEKRLTAMMNVQTFAPL